MLMRNAAHSHALTKHRRLKNKEVTALTPLSIRGVGPVLESNLYKHFSTYESIMKATEADLVKVQSIGPRTAKAIRKALDKRHQSV